jgi:hypothetical protein
MGCSIFVERLPAGDFMPSRTKTARGELLRQNEALDQTVWKVRPEVYAEFLARLDKPPSPNDKLRRMMNTRAPWDNDSQGDTPVSSK